MNARQYEKARRIAEEMLGAFAGHPRAVFTLSHFFQMQSAFEDQVEILERGLHHCPANLHLRKILVGAQQDAGHVEDAIETATELLKLENNFANAWSRIGLFIRYGLNEKALEACQAAHPLCAGNKALMSELDLLRGHALKTLGRREDAITSYRASLANKPQSGAPWWALADLKTYRFSPPEIEQLDSLTQSGSLAPHNGIASFAQY